MAPITIKTMKILNFVTASLAAVVMMTVSVSTVAQSKTDGTAKEVS